MRRQIQEMLSESTARLVGESDALRCASKLLSYCCCPTACLLVR